MKRIQYILGIIFAVLISNPCATFAQDTTFNRVVTVERDYQPEIEQAQMIHVTPSTLQVEVDPNPVIYSTYSTPLSIGFNLHPLQAAELRFKRPAPLNGIIDAAVGHHNTHLDFNYQLHKQPKLSANMYAKHDAYWGSNTLSHSKIGGQGTYCFNKSQLYFGIDGGNAAYTMIGKDKLQSLYHATAHIGICSNSQYHFQYNVQTGYKAFFTPELIEHQVRSFLDIYWKEGQHTGGAKIYAQNNLYSSVQDLTAIHNVRIQPFYELKDAKIRLHAGVNLDMNIGTNQMLSATPNISFAPSPNVQFEWFIIPEKLNLHTEINGYFATGSIDEGMHLNRYFDLSKIAARREAKTYIPVAANLGFTICPFRTFLIDIYGGYSLYMNDYTMEYDNTNMSYSYLLHNYQRGHVGASAHYHFKDIINVEAKGNYYFWKNLSANLSVYDRPEWDATLRVDVNIDQKWSLYSDNSLEGTRLACTTSQDEQLPMVIDLNIGAQYDINRWLNVYLQLGNYLHRKNPIYYGYTTQGCHFLAGVKYVF